MTAARHDTWMPFYIGDYLVDTMHLTTEQHGAYLLLLFACWKREGVLPLDDEELSNITKLSPAKWQTHKPRLLKFFIVDGGEIRQKRVTKELQKSSDLTAARSKAGKSGGRPKANGKQTGNQNESKTKANAPTDDPQFAYGLSKQNETPSPSPSSSLRSEHPDPEGSAGKQPDPLKALFDFGVSVLTASGIKEPQARSLIGKWRKELGDDAKLMGLFVTAKKHIRRRAGSIPHQGRGS